MSSNVSDVFLKVLKLSFEVSECKPMIRGKYKAQVLGEAEAELKVGRCRLTL